MAIFVSPTAGTRREPRDSYVFTRGTEVTFKTVFTSDSNPVKVDTATTPQIKIRQPAFVNNVIAGVPVGVDHIITTVPGSLVAGQEFEYEFKWTIPSNIIPSDEYIVSYEATIGALFLEYGSELFTIRAGPGMVNIAENFYATVDDVRNKKFNIDSYLPQTLAKDLQGRNRVIESHLRDATEKLREELNLTQSRGFSVNYRLFTVYYTVWSIMLAARGEDGSSVSDQNLNFWRSEWQNILRQEKRQGVLQGISLGRG